MSINGVRIAWIQVALTRFKNNVRKCAIGIFKNSDIAPDPGGMRDEMEREFLSRLSPRSR
jgi:hypothetical protein